MPSIVFTGSVKASEWWTKKWIDGMHWTSICDRTPIAAYSAPNNQFSNQYRTHLLAKYVYPSTRLIYKYYPNYSNGGLAVKHQQCIPLEDDDRPQGRCIYTNLQQQTTAVNAAHNAAVMVAPRTADRPHSHQSEAARVLKIIPGRPHRGRPTYGTCTADQPHS